jgi:hypothetical protein
LRSNWKWAGACAVVAWGVEFFWGLFEAVFQFVEEVGEGILRFHFQEVGSFIVFDSGKFVHDNGVWAESFIPFIRHNSMAFSSDGDWDDFDTSLTKTSN